MAFLLFIILIVVAGILFDAYNHKILFKIGFRNIFRRKTNTVIVIFGLMVATAIISSTLGVGDTMENMVEDEIFQEWQQTDVTVYNTTAEGNFIPFPYHTYQDLKEDILNIDNVGGVCGEVHGNIPVENPATRLFNPNVRLIGMDFQESQGFNSFYVDDSEVVLGEDEIFIDKKLAEELEVEKRDSLRLYTIGSMGSRDYIVRDIIQNRGWIAFHGENKVIMSLSESQRILDIPDQINFIRVTSVRGVEEGIKYSDQIFEDVGELLKDHPEYGILEPKGNKNQVLNEYKDSMSQFTDVFFIFGSFSIVAGIILAVNIFVMLGEERKSELGMIRAIGLKRRYLRRLFSYEGLIYSAAASFVGIFVGVILTYVIFFLLEDILAIFGGDISLLAHYYVNPDSIILAFSVGFLLSMGTILFSVTRISNLNIVRAIKNIPEPPISKKNVKIFYLAIFGLFVGIVFIGLGSIYEQLWLPISGMSLVIIGIGTFIRRWVGDRIAYTGVGMFLLIWWLLPFDALGFLEEYSMGLEMFILSGLFVVTAGVLIIMLNGHVLINAMEKISGSKKGFKAVMLSAVSHPLKEKFRTGMTIFIFALIIFAITVMGMIVGIFDTNIDRMIEEQSGGYDIVGMSIGRPIDNVQQEIIDNKNLSIDDFNHIDSAFRGVVPVNVTERKTTSVIGVDRYFVENSTFGMSEYVDEYHSPEEVWDAVLSDPHLVITNAPVDDYGPPRDDHIELGSTVTFYDNQNKPIEKTVVGYIDQYFISGYFMSKESVETHYNISSSTLFFFNVKEELDADILAREMNREFIYYGFQTIVISTVVQEALSATYMFFNLFSGFMGLGLVVGIAGLGVISLRSVHERRLEIGMMRAIGFKRRMIRYVFLIENSFITIMGIVLGSVLGIALGWLLWYDGFKPMGWEFYIPWNSIVMIALMAYGAMFLTAIPSANKASKVSPSEALRFE
ncbi:MAG: FtsX-like permease family protein [Thermoplasmata archaeon]